MVLFVPILLCVIFDYGINEYEFKEYLFSSFDFRYRVKLYLYI